MSVGQPTNTYLSNRMLMNFRTFLVVAAAVLAVSGCAETSRPEATGKGNLRGINAILLSPDIGFLVEERLQGAMNYKDTATRRIDDLDYTINFEARLAGDVLSTRIASQHVDVVANTEYLFALTGSLSAPTLLTAEYPERQWSGSETVFEARSLHLATSAGDLDVYLDAPGTAPVPGEARATAVYGELSAPFELAAGDYELILTTKDDPLDIRYRSRTFSQIGATSVIFSVFDPDPSITGDLSVRAMGAGNQSTELVDQDNPPTLRLVHAAFATGNVDMYSNDDFTTPLVNDLGFSELTADFDFETDIVPVTFTPTGDTGVLLLEDTLSVTAGSRNTAFLVGKPAELNALVFPDNRRPIETVARWRLTHVASNVPAVDVYVYLDSEDIVDIFPRLFSLPFLATTGYIENRIADSYQIAVTLPNEKDIIAGPVSIDLTLGGIVEMALLDTVDPNLFDIIIYDN